jgi:DedD protein
MASSQDTEITLGTAKLLFLFFGLVTICALFFALGYSLGRKSDFGPTTASAAAAPQTSPNMNKASSAAPAPAMTFYKSVEQKSASPELAPPADAKTETTSAGTSSAAGSSPAGAASGASAVDPATTLPSTSAYFVQVAAVSKQEDADALVDALKKKDYPAFVASQSAADKLFRVQLGPFTEVKDAETMRNKLVGDGYSPILKK